MTWAIISLAFFAGILFIVIAFLVRKRSTENMNSETYAIGVLKGFSRQVHDTRSADASKIDSAYEVVDENEYGSTPVFQFKDEDVVVTQCGANYTHRLDKEDVTYTHPIRYRKAMKGKKMKYWVYLATNGEHYWRLRRNLAIFCLLLTVAAAFFAVAILVFLGIIVI